MARTIAAVAGLLLLLAFKALLVAPPASTDFDTRTSLDRLERVLGEQTPHPVDTDASDRVRERLVAELSAIGLDPQVTDHSYCRSEDASPAIHCARVRNVLATLGGDEESPHLLVNAHYDSATIGAGAGDDGMGIAVMLSVAEALAAGPPLDRPVTFLFNEGEESGLIGASAFNENNPLAERVDSLVNIEARGTGGPALMFRQNGLIGLYGKEVRHPAANSLSADFATLIPNRTDAEEFRRTGRDWDMIEYAIAFNEARYHSEGDRLDALDPRSVGQMGSAVMATTRALADGPAAEGHDRVYTDVAGAFFVSLPTWLAAAVVLLLLLSALWIARTRGALRAVPWLFASYLLALAGGSAFAWLLTLLRDGQFWRGTPIMVFLAIHAATIAALLLAMNRRKNGDRRSRRAAAWTLILALGGLLSLFLPGALIFFVAPPLLAVAGMAIGGRVERALVGAAILVQAVMFAQLLALMEEILIAGPLFAGVPLVALIALPLIVEAAPEEGDRRTALPVAATAAVLAVAALLVPMTSARSPGPLSLIYDRDEIRDTSMLRIVSDGRRLPEAVADAALWEDHPLPHDGPTVEATPLPPSTIPTSSLEKVGERKTAGGRVARYVLRTDAVPLRVQLRFPEGSGVIGAGLPGAIRAFEEMDEAEPAYLRCFGRSCDGFTFDVEFADRRPVTAELATAVAGLPTEGAAVSTARPPDYQQKWIPDSSLHQQEVEL